MSTDGDAIADLLPPRSRHVQFARPEPRRQEHTTTADEYIAFARGRVGTRPQMMVCFRKCSGEVNVFAYSMLTRIHSENPDRGFTLSFSDTQVRVDGENLTNLFQHLREHRAVEIVEADRNELLQADCESAVSKILIISPK